MPDLWHVTARFATIPTETAAALEDVKHRFRRVLEVCGIRPVAGVPFDEVVDRLVENKFRHIDEINPLLEYREVPAWDARSGPYVPDPQALSQIEESFGRVKRWAGVAPLDVELPLDDLNLQLSYEWAEFGPIGKVALYHYCRNHAEVVHVRTPRHIGEVLRVFSERLHEACLNVVDSGDDARLLRSLRIPSGDWPPAGAAPAGLLQPFTKLVERQGRPLRVADPVAWWDAHEAILPDLTE